MLPPGSKLSHFEIVEKLGQGAMREVYKARDRSRSGGNMVAKSDV
jgi:hypothetical protein